MTSTTSVTRNTPWSVQTSASASVSFPDGTTAARRTGWSTVDSFEGGPCAARRSHCEGGRESSGSQQLGIQQLLGPILQLLQSLLSLFGRAGKDTGCEGQASPPASDNCGGPTSAPSTSGVDDCETPSTPKKVYVFGNRDYPLSTEKSAAKQVDLSKTMAGEFGGEIFNKLSPEAKAVSDNYGAMFGKSVVFDEDGKLVGIYDTKELEKLNSDYALYGNSTAQGKSLKTPDGRSFEIADNHYASPLTFDLNGNGKVGTTDMAHGRNFQMAPGSSRSAWAEAGDGILAFGSGKDATELFGNNTRIDGKSFDNGFDALKALATKYLGADRVAKGYLDKADLAELEQKANLHMIVAGEKPGQDTNARPVEDLGIERINLGYQEAGANTDAAGNQHREVGAGFVQNGQTKKVDDVWYRVA